MELMADLAVDVPKWCGRGKGAADVDIFYPPTAEPVDVEQIEACAPMMGRVTTNVEAL